MPFEKRVYRWSLVSKYSLTVVQVEKDADVARRFCRIF
jgi:hypothetical protein